VDNSLIPKDSGDFKKLDNQVSTLLETNVSTETSLDLEAFWKNYEIRINRSFNKNMHVFNLYKEYIKSQSLFSTEQKTQLFTDLKEIRTQSTDIHKNDISIVKDQISKSQILKEISLKYNK